MQLNCFLLAVDHNCKSLFEGLFFQKKLYLGWLAERGPGQRIGRQIHKRVRRRTLQLLRWALCPDERFCECSWYHKFRPPMYRSLVQAWKEELSWAMFSQHPCRTRIWPTRYCFCWEIFLSECWLITIDLLCEGERKHWLQHQDHHWHGSEWRGIYQQLNFRQPKN